MPKYRGSGKKYTTNPQDRSTNMEKDDKIRNQQAKYQKYVMMFTAMAIAGFLGLHYLHSQVWSTPTTSGGGGSSALRSLGKIKEDGNNGLIYGYYNATLVSELTDKVNALDGEVRAIKKTGVIMETDPNSLKKTHQLQDATRDLLYAKYGKHKGFRVRVDLEFQPSIPDFAEKGKDGSIVIEMAPIELIPVSVYTFLEVARTWLRGAFHRNAGHVLQVQVVSSEVHKHLPFQEYSKEFPHKKGTTGYCGRPSGPCWYVSIMDNTVNHGPGSQQQKNPYEADANFGKVVEGFDDVVPRIHSVKQDGWLSEENQIKIIRKTILVPDDSGDWVEWKDPTKVAKTTQ